MSSNNKHDISIVPWYHWPHMIIATGLWTGFWPWGPGTLAGFCGLLIWIGLFKLLTPFALFIATAILVIGTLVIGVCTDNVMEEYWGEDPRTVVIDEFFGTWIACIAALYCESPAYLTIIYAVIAFVLFRIIDMTKPLGCSWLDENIHGGWGCMLDDALAGFYAIIITLILRYYNVAQLIHDNIVPLLPKWMQL